MDRLITFNLQGNERRAVSVFSVAKSAQPIAILQACLCSRSFWIDMGQRTVILEGKCQIKTMIKWVLGAIVEIRACAEPVSGGQHLT